MLLFQMNLQNQSTWTGFVTDEGVPELSVDASLDALAADGSLDVLVATDEV